MQKSETLEIEGKQVEAGKTIQQRLDWEMARP